MQKTVMIARDVGDLKAANLQRSMVSMLKFYIRFIESEQEMFEERVHKLMDLEHVRKTVEKSEWPKKEARYQIIKNLKIIIC